MSKDAVWRTYATYPTVSVPEPPSATRLARSTIRCICASVAVASSRKTSPAAVNRTSRVERARRSKPSCASSLRIVWESAGCDTDKAKAALPKCRWRATCTKHSSCRCCSTEPHESRRRAHGRSLGAVEWICAMQGATRRSTVGGAGRDPEKPRECVLAGGDRRA